MTHSTIRRSTSFASAGIILATPAAAMAQEVVLIDDISGANFFIAVIAGVVLTIAFQLVLATLSVAAGITILGSMSDDDDDEGERDRGGATMRGVKSTVKKVTAGFGLWALITTSIALFFGSWLGVELSYTSSEFIGFTLALVIWSLVTLLLMMYEKSMAGALGRLAMSGMRSTHESVSSLFSSSAKKQKAKEAGAMARAVLAELDRDPSVQKFVDSVEGISMSMRGEDESPGMKEHAQKLRAKGAEATEIVKREAHSDKDAGSKVTDAAAQMAGVSTDKAESYRGQLEEYLRKTGKKELQPERLNRDLEELFSNPRGGMQSLLEDLSAIDRSAIENMIAGSSKNLSKSDVRKRADRLEKSLQQYRDKAMKSAHDMRGSSQSTMDQMRNQAMGYMDDAKYSAYQTAEDARKIAASAAWWMFASMIFSGVAAAAGGMIATS